MQTHRLFSTAATLLGLSLTAARADIYMELGINKRFFQTSAAAVKFDHGELNLYLRDGVVILAPCTSDPQLYFYGPHLGCALGITGFVAWGDFNRDGVSDANQYWSIDTVVPAIAIAPSYPQLCSLVSGPPSKLPRPLRVFRDGAVTVFHDLRTPQVTQYNIALYEMVRRYGSVRQVETAVTAGSIVTSGTLIVTVSGADFPVPVSIPITITVEIDPDTLLPVPVFAEEWAATVRLALQANAQVAAVYSVGGEDNSITLTEITPNGNDPNLLLNIDAGTTTSGFLPINSTNTVQGVLVSSPTASLKQMNEELVTGRYVFAFPSKASPTTVPVNMAVTIVPNVEALGSNPRVKGGFRFTSGQFDDGFYQMDPRTLSTITWTGNDASNIVPGDQIYFSILNKSEDRIEFPPTVPQTPVLLATPAVQSYTLPPGFFEVGDENVIDLRYQRTLPVTAVTYDRSKREFRMRVRFVDTYLGWAQGAFPLGTAGDVSPTGDFDRDGMTNVEEYAYQFPTQAEIIAGIKPQLPASARFLRVTDVEPETVNDPALKPTGPVAAALDGTNHVVFKVPYRALTGTSLKYEFTEVTTNPKNLKKKTKRIKPGADWEISFEDGATASRTVRIQVERIDPATGIVDSVGPYPDRANFPLDPLNPITVTMTKQYIVLRSKNPVADPLAPLPELSVKLTPVDIN
ncbi:hypothetical protein [Luteolibacter soli]|uniref:Uncharacterized protein n=1 Tax=Luteolibacter soli TaxID=3135280 RepID=A0ABU9B2L3_9BACT